MPLFEVKGVDRQSHDDVTMELEAESSANAKVKAELQGLVVTEVRAASEAEPPPVDESHEMPMRESEPSPDDEESIWSGGPSQWLGARGYGMALISSGALVAAGLLAEDGRLFAGLIPIGLAAGILYLRIRCTRYRLTSERLTISTGVLNRNVQDMELFRVKDSELARPLLLRLVGLGIVKLVTTDASTPLVCLRAVRQSSQLREKIRTQVNVMRQRRRVREVDVE